MNSRAKLKVMFFLSAALVCIMYIILPGLSGQTKPRTMDSQDRDAKNRGLKFQQASARRPQTGPSEEEGGVQRSQLVVNGGKQPQAAPRLDPNQKQNVFAQPPNQPIHRAIVLNQGIPQPNAGSNITISNQEINSHVNRSHPEVALQTGGSAKEHSQQGVNRQDTTSMDQPDISALVASQLGLHPDVKIVSSTLPISSNTSKIECVPLPKSPRLNVKICIYPIQEDKWVSGSLKMNKLWEEELVLTMQAALQADPSMMLLDLGCNLGMYALFAAAMGRNVLAVEMLPNNVMMIQKSLTLSGLGGKVLIVNNALYRDHRTLQTRFMAQNVGGSRLNTSKVYENIDSSRPPVSVRTICLDDLSPLLKGTTVFMKIDIENSEHHALACAHIFFSEVNVKVVQIEWLNRTPEESRLISDFMAQHSYALSMSPLSYSPLPPNTAIAKADVYFLKKSTFNIL